jgi:hypothetical protein
MEINISYANMTKYLNTYGDQGWCVVNMQVHKPMSPVLANTVFTVWMARERLPFTGDGAPFNDG